jgi:hypothetical protein
MHRRLGEMQGKLMVTAWQATQVRNGVSAG